MTQVVDTSLLAYKKILPKLPQREASVYSAIRDATRNGFDLTDKELSRVLHWEINCVTGRRNMLVKKGLVLLSRRRTCGVTGEYAKAWKVKQQ